MGRAPKLLRILLWGLGLDEHWRALAEQGHTIDVYDEAGPVDLAGYDLVVGPRSWRLLPGMSKWVPSMVKEARAIKYPAKPKVKK